MALLMPSEEEIALYREMRTGKGYAKHLLAQDLYPKQADMLDLLDANPRVAVKGAHSVGKTRGIAAWALKQLNAWPDSIVLTTAPTWEQVRRLLWGNIKTVLREAREARGYAVKGLMETEIRIGPENYMLGLSTNEGVRFQGFHSGHLTIIFDEAPGVRDDIWKAADGISAGGQVWEVALGNPVIGSGRFFDCFSESSPFVTLSISAFDTPNLLSPETGLAFTIDELVEMERHDARHGTKHLLADPRIYLARRKWVLDMYRQHGPDSAEYQSRVLARFPDQAHDALFPLPWLRRAQRLGAHWMAPLSESADARWRAGIDVAGEGSNETAVGVWQGRTLQALLSWPDADAFQKVLDFLAPFRERLCWGPPRPVVRVDTIGQGHHFANRLEEHGYRGYIGRVNVQQAADQLLPLHRLKDRVEAKARFHDLKAWLGWQTRLALQEEGHFIGRDLSEQAITQLSGIRYRINPRGKIQVESKDEMQKRGMDSPDLADCIMLGCPILDGLLHPNSISYTATRRRTTR